MVAKKAGTKKSRAATLPHRPAVANDTLQRLENLTSELDRASAEAEFIARHVQQCLAAEEVKYQLDPAIKPRRRKRR